MTQMTRFEKAAATRVASPDRLLKSVDMMRILDNRVRLAQSTPECFWAYIVRTYPPSQIFMNVLHSESTWTGFLNFREEAKDRTKMLAGLDLEAFVTEMNFRSDPEDVFERRNKSVSPLTLYVMGKALKVPFGNKYKAEAVEQVLEEPELLHVYPEKLRVHFPITEKEVFEE